MKYKFIKKSLYGTLELRFIENLSHFQFCFIVKRDFVRILLSFSPVCKIANEYVTYHLK